MITQMNIPTGHGWGGGYQADETRSYLMYSFEAHRLRFWGGQLCAAPWPRIWRMRSLVTSKDLANLFKGFIAAIRRGHNEGGGTSRFPGAERCQYVPPEFPAADSWATFLLGFINIGFDEITEA